MKNTLYIAILLLAQVLFAQEPEQRIGSKISGVTVYTQGALITRTANVMLVKGKQKLVFTGLNAQMDKESFRLKAKGEITVLSVTHFNTTERIVDKNPEVEKLELEIEQLENQKEKFDAKLTVLNDEEKMILDNKKLGGTQNQVTAAKLTEAANFFRTRLTEISNEKLEIGLKKAEISKKITELTKKIKDIELSLLKAEIETEVLIESEKVENIDFTFTYFVQQASWTPIYDVKVSNTDKPLNLVFKAQVNQLTGEDWSKVNLTLSTSDPNRNTGKPELGTWLLDNNQYIQPITYKNSNVGEGTRTVSGYVFFAETSKPLAGAVIRIENMPGLGAVSNSKGYFSLEVPKSIGSIICSYPGLPSSTKNIENGLNNFVLGNAAVVYNTAPIVLQEQNNMQYQQNNKSMRIKATSSGQGDTDYNIKVNTSTKGGSAEYAIAEPYTIPANGKKYTVEILSKTVPANYTWHCIPKAASTAWLTAQIVGWEQYELLTADVNLYYEGSFVGTSKINTDITSDTLDIALGKDENVIVTRKRIKDFNDKQFLGTNTKKSYQWQLEIRNKKATPIQIKIEDQIPVSTDSRITVELDDKGTAEYNSEKGILTWRLELQPSEMKKQSFKYSVKFPSKSNLVLED